MQWNWQQPDWPEFTFDEKILAEFEAKFLHHTGLVFGAYSHLQEEDKNLLRVELISDEALKSSEIEGEYLDRDSLQSSIRRHFGLHTDNRRVSPAEAGIAEMMMAVFTDFEQPLTHETLFNWHTMLMNGRNDLAAIGCYRSGEDPMQVVSGPIHEPKVHFEAPPSHTVVSEMERFVAWFNRTSPQGVTTLPAVTRAGIAHLYFESIHPFEDGNGRIGRALSEKALAQALQQPTLIALAAEIQRHRKDYYAALAAASRDNEITEYLEYFAQTVLNAVASTQHHIEFLIEKAKLLDRLENKLNARQEKCLLRMFREGPAGFTGGLSAKNYMSITGALRATATRDLSDLVEKKALIKTGERKSTRYFLNIPSNQDGDSNG